MKWVVICFLLVCSVTYTFGSDLGTKSHGKKCELTCPLKAADCAGKCKGVLICHNTTRRCVCPDTNPYNEIDDQCLSDKFLVEVSQHYTDHLDRDLHMMIKHYNTFELVYKSYSAFYERADVNLPGFGKYFRGHSVHMRDQGQNVVDYINTRGGFVLLKTVEVDQACTDVSSSLKINHVTTNRLNALICNFMKKDSSIKRDQIDRPGLYGIEDAVAMEKFLHGTINSIMEKANGKFIDPYTKHYMETLLEKERVATMQGQVDVLRGFTADNYVVGEYEMDQQLAQ